MACRCEAVRQGVWLRHLDVNAYKCTLCCQYIVGSCLSLLQAIVKHVSHQSFHVLLLDSIKERRARRWISRTFETQSHKTGATASISHTDVRTCYSSIPSTICSTISIHYVFFRLSFRWREKTFESQFPSSRREDHVKSTSSRREGHIKSYDAVRQ